MALREIMALGGERCVVFGDYTPTGRTIRTSFGSEEEQQLNFIRIAGNLPGYRISVNDSQGSRDDGELAGGDRTQVPVASQTLSIGVRRV